jgi:hypothetical protein
MTQRSGQFSFFSSRRNQRGAALIEYVLMLVVLVALVRLVTLAFSGPMSRFLNGYMGAYVQCLLEFGELPSLGGESTTGGECNVRFQPATLADGRPPLSDSERNANRTDADRRDKGSQAEISQANRSGGSGGRGGGGRRSARNDGSGIESNPADSKTVVIDLNEDGSGSFFRASGSSLRPQSVATRRDRVSRYFLTESEALELEKAQSRRATPRSSEGTQVQKNNKKYTVEPPPKRTLASESADEFSFGNMIRWIIISILILFVLIFLGGLFSQFSRSSRKS